MFIMVIGTPASAAMGTMLAAGMTSSVDPMTHSSSACVASRYDFSSAPSGSASPEVDHVGFDESVAWHVAAVGQSAMAVRIGFVVEIRHDVGGVIFCMALHAVRGTDGAMQIDDDVAAIAGFFMQCVEVLCGEQRQHASLFQFDERFMCGARLCGPHG